MNGALKTITKLHNSTSRIVHNIALLKGLPVKTRALILQSLVYGKIFPYALVLLPVIAQSQSSCNKISSTLIDRFKPSFGLKGQDSTAFMLAALGITPPWLTCIRTGIKQTLNLRLNEPEIFTFPTFYDNFQLKITSEKLWCNINTMTREYCQELAQKMWISKASEQEDRKMLDVLPTWKVNSSFTRVNTHLRLLAGSYNFLLKTSICDCGFPAPNNIHLLNHCVKYSNIRPKIPPTCNLTIAQLALIKPKKYFKLLDKIFDDILTQISSAQINR